MKVAVLTWACPCERAPPARARPFTPRRSTPRCSRCPPAERTCAIVLPSVAQAASLALPPVR
eukprot:7236850-Alexandrium_andersonii.AAC.1